MPVHMVGYIYNFFTNNGIRFGAYPKFSNMYSSYRAQQNMSIWRLISNISREGSYI